MDKVDKIRILNKFSNLINDKEAYFLSFEILLSYYYPSISFSLITFFLEEKKMCILITKICTL